MRLDLITSFNEVSSFVAIIPRTRDGDGRADDPGSGYDPGNGYILNRLGTDGKLVAFDIDPASFPLATVFGTEDSRFKFLLNPVSDGRLH